MLTEAQTYILRMIARTTHGAILYAGLDTSEKRTASRMRELGLVEIIGVTIYASKKGKAALTELTD